MKKLLKYVVIIMVIGLLSSNIKTLIDNKQNPSKEKQEEINQKKINKIKKSEKGNLKSLNDNLSDLESFISESKVSTCTMMERGSINMKLKLINKKSYTINNNIKRKLKKENIEFKKTVEKDIDNKYYNTIIANEEWINTCSINEKDYKLLKDNYRMLSEDYSFLNED